MANVVMIMGASGTGKSSSIKTLNPKETVVINVLKKRLPLKEVILFIMRSIKIYLI